MYAEDQTFRGRIDDFIQQNIQNVVNSKHFFGLPELKMEIIGEEEAGADSVGGGGGAFEGQGRVCEGFPQVLTCQNHLNGRSCRSRCCVVD